MEDNKEMQYAKAMHPLILEALDKDRDIKSTAIRFAKKIVKEKPHEEEIIPMFMAIAFISASQVKGFNEEMEKMMEGKE